jgi:hypothetical protein
MKICRICKIPKELTSFYSVKRNVGGLSHSCSSCAKLYAENKRKNKDSTFHHRILNKLCTVCGKAVEGDLKRRATGTLKRMCRLCLTENAAKLERYRQEKNFKGLCYRCGQRPHRLNRKLCQECANRILTQSKARAEKTFFDRRARNGSDLKYSVVAAKMLWSLWKEQRGKCALTGIKLTRDNVELDHITPVSKGGLSERSNLRWVLKNVNQAKRALSDEDFISLCKSVVDYERKKSQ